jgi:hypothetical protein
VTGSAGGHPSEPPEPGAVRQVAVPPAARALSTLARVDYADAFLTGTGPAGYRAGEEWARAVLEGAPADLRKSLSRGWRALGLRLGSTHSDRFVLGWAVRRSGAGFALLRASGRFGLSGELLFEPREHELLFATFVQLDNPVARAAWAVIAPRHRKVVEHLLAQATRPELPGRVPGGSLSG